MTPEPPRHGRSRAGVPNRSAARAPVHLERGAASAEDAAVDVLVVEDEAPVRSLMCDILKKAGYTVRAVAEGDAALAVLEERRFRAIICDLGMPLVNGIRLYAHLTDSYPALAQRVLFVTGMANAPAIKDFIARSALL